MKVPKLRIILLLVLVIVGCLSIGVITWYVTRPAKPSTVSTAQKPSSAALEKPQEPQLRFAAMGDMIAHDSVVNNAKTTNGYDFTQYFTRVQNLYTGADVTFCNPETLAAGSAYGISGYPTFNAPIEFPRDLNKEGCNLINLATNHIGDKSQAAINATIDVWNALPILAATGANKTPAEQRTVKYFTKNGLKVAFVAFADFSNNKAVSSYGLNIYHDTALVSDLLTEARKNADVVIVSAHWGTEDSNTVNADQVAAAQLFASLGADVVIGTGPHVLQKVTSLTRPDGGTTLVWYSIGNMLSSQLQLNELTGGVAGFTVAKKDGKVIVTDLTFKATFMSYDWPAADRAAGRLETRSNLALYPLANAGDQVTKFGTNLSEREAYIKQMLGTDVPITITP